MEQQKIDLDALEAALARVGNAAHPPSAAAEAIVYGHNALPALIAELRELRARTTPEPIGDKHKDGNWWLVWHENIGAWCKARWDLGCGQWDFEGYVWFERTPTHALPMPGEPEAQ
jgi:hypothetical protein